MNLPSDIETGEAADLDLVVVPVEKKVPCLPEVSVQDDNQVVNGGVELLQIADNQHWAPYEGEFDGERVASMVSLVVVAVVA